MTDQPDLRAAVAAGVVGSEESFRALLSAIVEVARSIFGAKASSILLLDEETEELVFEAVVGEGEETLLGQRFPAGKGIAGWVLATRSHSSQQRWQIDSNARCPSSLRMGGFASCGPGWPHRLHVISAIDSSNFATIGSSPEVRECNRFAKRTQRNGRLVRGFQPGEHAVDIRAAGTVVEDADAQSVAAERTRR